MFAVSSMVCSVRYKVNNMALFRADSIVLSYADVETAKRWWVDTFGYKEVGVPEYWDNPLPSDVARQMDGDHEPTILLNDQAEVTRAGFERSKPVVTVVFTAKLKKAHEHISSRVGLLEPIQDGGDTQFFELRDKETNLIQVCKES